MRSVNFFILMRKECTSDSSVSDPVEVFTEDFLAKNALNSHQKASNFVYDNFKKIQEKILNWKFNVPEPRPLSKEEKEKLNEICKNSLDKKERKAATKKLQSFKEDYSRWETEKFQHKYSVFRTIVDQDDLNPDLVKEYFSVIQ